MRSRLLNLVSAAALAVGGVLLPAAPANAAPDDCFHKFACFYKNFEYTFKELTRDNATTCENLDKPINDTMSSVINYTDMTLVLYQHYNWLGKYVLVPTGGGFSRLDYVPIYNQDNSFYGYNTFNDRVSSFCILWR
ncbi:peptidase inhibitor family I36 protein [Sphaerisporangium sp. B11E5]|uniref:peptidase inhibitor family I36 protein n=1 Tax=Sphaerisporangium sp. B11E5 TaxID=3153563 RepID=UPI00325DC753